MVKDLSQLPEMNDVLEFDESLFEVVGTTSEEDEQLTSAPYSYWKSVWKQLFKNKVAMICIAIVIILVFFTIFGPMMGSSTAFTTLPGAFGRPRSEPPSATHWFGTSMGGRDLWHDIWEGAQFSLKLALVVSLINVALGLVIGGFWGYIRALDPIMIEISNVISNIPSLLIYIMVLELLPNSSGNEAIAFWNSVLVMTMFGWMGLASTMRNQIIIIRNREFNIASEALGSRAHTIIIHNLLPNLVSIIAQVVISFIPSCISSEVSLIYFGAFPATQMSLGQVLNTAFSAKNIATALRSYPHTLFIPAVVMILLTVAFFYFGMAVADATDPKRHR